MCWTIVSGGVWCTTDWRISPHVVMPSSYGERKECLALTRECLHFLVLPHTLLFHIVVTCVNTHEEGFELTYGILNDTTSDSHAHYLNTCTKLCDDLYWKVLTCAWLMSLSNVRWLTHNLLGRRLLTGCKEGKWLTLEGHYGHIETRVLTVNITWWLATRFGGLFVSCHNHSFILHRVALVPTETRNGMARTFVKQRH